MLSGVHDILILLHLFLFDLGDESILCAAQRKISFCRSRKIDAQNYKITKQILLCNKNSSSFLLIL